MRGLTPNELYDEMLKSKVYIRPGMDMYTEFADGVGRQKHFLLATVDYNAMSLDEWADTQGVTGSELIEMLSRAEFKKDRNDKGFDYVDFQL